MQPEWMSRKNKLKRQNKDSASQERSVAKLFGGRRLPGSGSSWRAPHDVKSPDNLIECKYTDHTTYVLRVSDWKKLADNAHNQGRDPIMVISFRQYGINLEITEQ